MTTLFGIDIAALVANELGDGLLPGVLYRRVAGSRTPGSLSGGLNPTETQHAFRGFVSNQSETRIGGTVATQAGEFVSILGGTINVTPRVGDRVEIDGRDFELIELTERDPASALYEFRVQE